MNGLRYYRIKRGFSPRELAESANVSRNIITVYETPSSSNRSNGETYLRLSDVLGVPIDELLREDFPDEPDTTLGDGIRHSETAVACNPITVYREAQKLSFRALAHRLGRTTRECGRKACARAIPLDEHIQALSTYEGITPEAFIKKYSFEKG